MTKLKRRKPSSRQRLVKPGARRTFILIVTLVLVGGGVVAFVLLRGGELTGKISPPPSSTTWGNHPTAAVVATNAGFQILHGRWLRPDGGYILDIREVGPSGSIDAVYLNPRPITIA